MIKFEVSTENNKMWEIKSNEDETIKLNLISSTITNKFFIVSEFIEGISEFCGDDFDIWFLGLLKEYKASEENQRYQLLKDNTSNLIFFVDSYIDSCNIDFSLFVDETKAKKTSILFRADEIELIIKLSGYLKLYSIFSNTKELKLDIHLHRKIYNLLAEKILESEVVTKIFTVVQTRTYRYNSTDRYMWSYINMIKCKNIEVHMIEIFNFIMNSILVLCEKDRNPIIYFVGVIESSIKWFLRSVYKNHIVYEDSMSTEDVHGLDMNNLKSYSCNDTLGRLKGIALTKIYNKLEEDSISIFGTDKSSEDKAITDFQGRLEDVRFISPICECIVFPILSILTSIPYNHFKTIGPDHSVILSIFVQDLFNRTFRLNEYKELVSILHFYSTNVPAVLTTYKIKNVTRLLKRHNETKNFFGFGADKKLSPIVLTNEIISYFIGRISRVSFVDIYTGKKLIGIPLSKIETDMIDFYIKMFGGKMNKQFHKMRELIFSDFKSYSTI